MKQTLIALALAAASPILLAAGPRPPTKVTGGVRFVSGGQQMAASFSAHAPAAGRPAKGNLNLRRFTPGGHSDCIVRVTNVTIRGKVAMICGRVAADDITANRGSWVSIVVVDGGTPGRNGDLIGLAWAPSHQAALASAVTASRAALRTNRANLVRVTAGNLKVH